MHGAQTWRCKANVFKVRVSSPTCSAKPSAFYGKTDFYLKNKPESLGERGAVSAPARRWSGRAGRFRSETQVSGKLARIWSGSDDVLRRGAWRAAGFEGRGQRGGTSSRARSTATHGDSSFLNLTLNRK